MRRAGLLETFTGTYLCLVICCMLLILTNKNQGRVAKVPPSPLMLISGCMLDANLSLSCTASIYNNIIIVEHAES